MKKILVLSFAFMFAITPFFSVNFAFAAGPTYVDTNVSFNQGLTKVGGAIDVSRSDETMALGVEDNTFVSLGYGGEIVLAFPMFIGGGSLSITAYERTDGTYPLEEAEVYVSSDNSTWTMIGTADNTAGDPTATTFELGDECIKYVKLVDVTNPDLHGDNSDGYDLDAVGAVYESECNLEEPCEKCSSGNDLIMNDNSALVMNRVVARSNTGGNVAGGSYAGDGGDGGAILGNDVEKSSTGNGGAGGDSGIGGTVITGNSISSVDFYNEVNSSRTTINRCACVDENCCGDEGHSMILNRNRAIVMNDVVADADTGLNESEGSYAGSGGDAGTIDSDDINKSSTGNGGLGGDSLDGGYIQTGVARSNVTFVNVINRTLTRISR